MWRNPKNNNRVKEKQIHTHPLTDANTHRQQKSTLKTMGRIWQYNQQLLPRNELNFKCMDEYKVPPKILDWNVWCISIIWYILV